MKKALEILSSYRENCRAAESLLHPKAARFENHLRYAPLLEDHRLPYKRDIDRIIYSKAYSRISDKTQVVYLLHHDHVTKRGQHVQWVANYAKSLGAILKLNVDLIEAIALGHDVGHPPFGHEGEEYLSLISQSCGEGHFAHPWQSCRLLFTLEPLNLDLLIYDGILTHDGGLQGRIYSPHWGKTWDQHFQELEMKRKGEDASLWPGSLEGCLVRLCDTLCYIGRDIEDAFRLGLIDPHDLPETPFSVHNHEFLSQMTLDIVENSFEQDYIALSEEGYETIQILRKFNFEKIYYHPSLKKQSSKIFQAYELLFHKLLKDAHQKGKKSDLYQSYLHDKPYKDSFSLERLTLDYLSGMTNTHFLNTFQNHFSPLWLNS